MRTYRIIAVLCCLSVAAAHAADAFRVTELPQEQGTMLVPYALNDLSQVVGTMRRDDGPWHLFLWDRTHGLQDLAPVYPAQCDINNQGQIVAAAPSPDASTRAFLREPDGRIEYLGAPRQTSRAFALNERAQVVGWIFHPERGTRRAFLWDRTSGLRELTTPQGTPAVAAAISDAGHVFGHLQYHLGTRLQQRPCYWQHTDAPTLEPAVDTPASEFILRDLNNHGVILGLACLPDGARLPLLLEPPS